MKLKKASGIETPIAPVADIPDNTDRIAEKQMEEMQAVPDAASAESKEAIIDNVPREEIQADIIDPSPSEKIPQAEQAPQDPIEPVSIITNSGIEEVEEIKQEKIAGNTESKEFFPNFQIARTVDIDMDLTDLQDMVTIEEGQQESAVSQESPSLVIEETAIQEPAVIHPEKAATEDIVSVHSEKTEAVQDTTPVPAEKSSIEEIPEIIATEEPTKNNTVITPEYVAEVKTELSEQRRAGFRFFTQKKTKIMAGMSLVILSISAVALFSGSLLSTDIQKSGKSDIHGTIENTAPEVEDSNAETIPTLPVQSETGATENATGTMTDTTVSNYELGRDYNIRKNTKKNIRSAKPNLMLTGTEMPTP